MLVGKIENTPMLRGLAQMSSKEGHGDSARRRQNRGGLAGSLEEGVLGSLAR